MLSPALFANDTPQPNTSSLPLDKKDSAAHQQQGIGNGTKRDVAKLSTFVLGIVILIGVFFVIFVVLPYFIGWHEKCGDNCTPVNKATCDCKCFDGLNKGPYGRGGYKYVYFNSEKNTFIILILFVIYVSLGQRAFEVISRLVLTNSISWITLIVFCTTLQSNFYGFWAHVNYINDEFFLLNWHQAYFTITELMVTVCVFKYLNAYENVETELPMWIIFTISLTHIVQSMKDQAIDNFLKIITGEALQRGKGFLSGRDIGFLVGDVSCFLYSMYRLGVLGLIFRWIKKRDNPQDDPVLLQFRRKMIISICTVCGIVAFLSLVTYAG